MNKLYKERAAAEMAAEQLKVYAQPQRLMILSCLLEGERMVSEIDALTGIGQPALSQQLGELRRKELVRTRRQGTQIFYALTDEKVEFCVACVEAMLSGPNEAQWQLQAAVRAKSARSSRDSHSVGTAQFARVIRR